MNTELKYIGNITKDLTQFSDSDEQNYQLQTRLSTYYQNNPKAVLLHSQKFSNEEDSFGNKIPLGGELNEYLNNINNAPSQDESIKAFYSDEFPFWDFNCKNETPENKTQVNETQENFGNETQENETQENFGNETQENETLENKINWGKIILTILLILFFIIIGLIILNKYGIIDFIFFTELLNIIN